MRAIVSARARWVRMFEGLRPYVGLFLLLTVGCVPQVLAQGMRVEGGVRDASGASVPGAQVKLSAGSHSAQTITDNSGAFAFDGVGASAGTISVTAEGFHPVEPAWRAAAGAVAQISVTLQPGVPSQQGPATAARTSLPVGGTPG